MLIWFLLLLLGMALHGHFVASRKLEKLQKAVFEERALLLTSDSEFVRKVISSAILDYARSRESTSTGPR